jgi:hypothetical protein
LVYHLKKPSKYQRSVRISPYQPSFSDASSFSRLKTVNINLFFC